jgi:probable F420-dependent oxidoreductase
MRSPRELALATVIGRLGVWDAGLCFAPAAQARAAAAELEAAGYQAAWLHEGGRDPFVAAAVLLGATRALAVGTSIASIWVHEPAQMAGAARTVGEAFPGRFVLGIGVSHPGAGSWRGPSYERPVAELSAYLDAMDEATWYGPRPDPPVPRMIAALGPRMVELARRRSRGTIPYLAPVEYTRAARAALGPDPVLAVHQAIVLDRSPGQARALAQEHVGVYLRATNYRNNWLRSGFEPRDLDGDGSERLIEGLVAVGGVDEVAARVQAHLDAGADHVCVNPLGRDAGEVPVIQLQRLAAALPAAPPLESGLFHQGPPDNAP